MIQNKFKKKNCLFFLLTLESVALITIQEIRLSNIQKMSLCNKKKKQIYQIYSIFITLHRLHLIRKTKIVHLIFSRRKTEKNCVNIGFCFQWVDPNIIGEVIN